MYSTTYDLESGDFIGPDGRTYNAGTGAQATGTQGSGGTQDNGTQDSGTQGSEQGQGTSWQSLITGAVTDR